MIGNEISLQSVVFYYRKDKIIINNLSVILKSDNRQGKIIAVMGESGAGKTTLLRLLNNYLRPISGEIIISPPTTLISFLPQEEVLFDHLTIGDNIRLLRQLKRYRAQYDESKVQRLIKRLGLQEAVDSQISVANLSGGEKQRVCLIRAMSVNPSILLLDEPTVALDTEVKRRFLIELRDIALSSGCLVLYVTHDFNDAFLTADEVLYISTGGGRTFYTHQKIKDFCVNFPSPIANLGVHYPDVAIFEIMTFSSTDFSLESNNQKNIKISFIPEVLVKSDQQNSICLTKVTSNEFYDIFQSPKGQYVVKKRGENSWEDTVNVVINGKINVYYNELFQKSVVIDHGYFQET